MRAFTIRLMIADPAGGVNGEKPRCPKAHQPLQRMGVPEEAHLKPGRGERIRTSGLYVPNVALYQAKLHPDLTHGDPALTRRSGRTLRRANR